MCAMCGSSPCVSRCPNAPEPKPVYECSRCGYGIQEKHSPQQKRRNKNGRTEYTDAAD